MRLAGSSTAGERAKTLRRSMTPPEALLWRALRRNEEGLRFRRQHPAGDYILDFYCATARLAIEVDGLAHDFGDRPIRDARRDAWLADRGVCVLRYPARDVLANLDGVVRHILLMASKRRKKERAHRLPPPPSPSAPPPPGGGG